MKKLFLPLLSLGLATCGISQTVTDSFNGSLVNSSKWEAIAAYSDTTVTENNGSISLKNGGKILSQASFGNSIEVNGRFRFSGNVHDNFIFVFRTTSQTHGGGSIELTNGIAVRIEPENDTSSSFCTFLVQRMNDSFQFGITNRAFLMNQFYNFRITDDGTNFSFYFDDMTTPLVSGSDNLTLGNRVGVYNRPGVGGGSSISAGSQVDIDWLDISSPGRNPFQAPFNLDLVAYYPFTGNANNETGSGNNGVAEGATLTTDRFLNPNKAYYFGGDGDDVRIQPAPNFWSTGSFTFSCWIKIQPGGLYQPRIIHNGTLDVGLTDTSGSPLLFFAGFGFNGLVTTNHLSTGVNYHVAGTYDGITVRLYLDGIEILSQNVNWTLQVTSIPLGIGRNLQTGTDWFSGTIDDVRLYNRALTKAEIKQLFSIESPIPTLAIKTAAVKLEWFARTNVTYQVEWTTNFQTWSNLTSVLGSDNNTNITDWVDGTGRFYRLVVP